MKVFAISDLHLGFNADKPMDIFGEDWANHFEKISADWKQKVGENDLVLVAGDISWAMKMEDAQEDLNAICALAGNKVLIKGNHEFWWQSISGVRAMLSNKTFAVQNDCLRFENVLVCGTRGWLTPEVGKELSKEDEKLYKREVERLKLSLDAMKKQRREGDKVVCMMHFPPYSSRNDGTLFTQLLEEAGVDICVFGHIHTAHTRGKNLVQEKNGVKYFQTSCDQVGFKLVEIL